MTSRTRTHKFLSENKHARTYVASRQCACSRTPHMLLGARIASYWFTACSYMCTISFQVPHTLCLIELVIKSCEEAGASLLEIELADSGQKLLLSVAPNSACVSIESIQRASAPNDNQWKETSISLEDCSLIWLVSQSTCASRNVRILLEALGACMWTRFLVTRFCPRSP